MASLKKLGVVAGRWGVQDHPLLSREFEASLGYRTTYLKEECEGREEKSGGVKAESQRELAARKATVKEGVPDEVTLEKERTGQNSE